MGEFDSLGAFLEHVSLVMDADRAADGDRVSLMTLHGAKGLEFDVVFLPGWEEGLFPHQRALDENGKEGLEEERPGLCRHHAREAAAHHQLRAEPAGARPWQSAMPSRFLDELSEEHAELVMKTPVMVTGGMARPMAGYGASRFEEDAHAVRLCERPRRDGSARRRIGRRRAARNRARGAPRGDRRRVGGEEHGERWRTGSSWGRGCSTRSSGMGRQRDRGE